MSKELKIAPKTRSIADRMKPLLSVDVKGNLVETNGDKIIEAIVKQDGRDYAAFLEQDDYKSDLLAGLHLAGGEVTHDAMVKNKDLATVSGTFELGRGRLELSYDRHQRVPNRVLDKESGLFKVDGEKDLYGDSQLKYKVRGAQNSKGELKASREFLQDMFSRSFSS